MGKKTPFLTAWVAVVNTRAEAVGALLAPLQRPLALMSGSVLLRRQTFSRCSWRVLLAVSTPVLAGTCVLIFDKASEQLLVALTRRPVWQALSPVFRYSTGKEEKSQEKPKNSPAYFPRPRTTSWAAPAPSSLQRCGTQTAQRALGLLICSLLAAAESSSLEAGAAHAVLSFCCEPHLSSRALDPSLGQRPGQSLLCACGGPGAQQMPCVQNADPLAPCVAVASGTLHSPASAEEFLPRA